MSYKIRVLNYFSDSQKKLYDGISELTEPVKNTYRQFNTWYSKVFLPGLEKGLRKIVVATDEKNKPVGVALIKNTPEEKKLCCLFVHQDYRGKGIGSNLLKETSKILNEPLPYCSISEKNLYQYKKLFNNFNFSYKKKGVYQKNTWEYYYNNEATEVLKKKVLLPLYTRSGIKI